ncbi:hypothetical protein ACLOEZ_10440 [Levilactobacillus brevis]|uniref:hypothetical protein n=1 Tax=Levilactobacillus brevis TaxID=1580 RepID=UPI003EC0C70C
MSIILIDYENDPQIVLTEMLSKIASGDFKYGLMYMVPLTREKASAQIDALHTIAEEQLVTDVELLEDDNGTNLSISPNSHLTPAGRSIFNPLKLQGKISDQIIQLLDAVDEETLGKITGICFNYATFPPALATVIDEGYISGIDKYQGNNTVTLFFKARPSITDKGYNFINMQKERTNSVTTNIISNSNNANLMSGDHQVQKNTNTYSFEQTAKQNLADFEKYINQLSESDQKIAKEIKTDIQNGSVYPNKWEKFRNFFEKNPQITGLIGKLIVSATTIGTSFIN